MPKKVKIMKIADVRKRTEPMLAALAALGLEGCDLWVDPGQTKGETSWALKIMDSGGEILSIGEGATLDEAFASLKDAVLYAISGMDTL